MAESAALPAPQRRLPLLALSESRLARLAAAGDERAFAAIFERYHQELYRYCRAILRNADDAQDALQSTMASALRSLPGESRDVALRPWLYRVAHNEALDLIRRRRDTSLDEDAGPMSPPAHVEVETRERLRELIADLDALPDRLRSALVMRELSGLAHDEIGAALEMSPGAARQAVYEARAALLELAAGREMSCPDVRRLVSDRDGRVLRGRRVRAHLRSCESCRDFRAAISTRRSDLALIAPPLPAAASGALAGLLGGAGGAGGLFGAKGAGIIAATAAIGVGAVGLTAGEGGGAGTKRSSVGATNPSIDAAGHVPGHSRPSATGHGLDHGRASGRAGGRRADASRPGAPGAAGDPSGRPADPGPTSTANTGPGPAAPSSDSPAPQQPSGPGSSEPASAGGGQPAAPPGSSVASGSSGGQNTTPAIGPGEHGGFSAAPATPPVSGVAGTGSSGSPGQGPR